MAASVQFRPQERDLGMVMREVDENLAIFLGIRSSEKEKNGDPLINFDTSKEPQPDGELMLRALQPETNHNGVDDDCLNIELDANDYDWLLTQREISLLPSEEVEAQDSTENRTKTSNCEVISPKSELAKKASVAAAKIKPLSSGDRKPTPRAATPTERRPTKSKPSRASTTTSRSALATSKKTTSTSSKPQTRPSTPSSATVPARPRPKSRPATPTRKHATPSVKSSTSDSGGSSSGRKMGPTVLKNPGASQTVKSKQSKSSAIQKPCSPVKVRPHNGNAVKNESILLSKSQECGSDDVNPVLMGTKMVERVVSMRKLAPPKQDDCVSIDNPKKSSVENSGFGRSLSKKSLDMAIRHMDIRQSANVLSSSAICGNQSSSCKSSKVDASESHLASSRDSSKSSNGINSYFRRLSFRR